jgi:hypothetical protein
MFSIFFLLFRIGAYLLNLEKRQTQIPDAIEQAVECVQAGS